MQIIPNLPAGFKPAIIIVQHLHPHQGGFHIQYFQKYTNLKVKEADEKEPIQGGTIYFAPPNYHLLVEDDLTFTLSVDARVNFSRPSIDVLFETAADAFGKNLTGIVLTGANYDGARGLKYIRQKGGTTLVQAPETAEVPSMPQAAIEQAAPDHVIPLNEMTDWLKKNM